MKKATLVLSLLAASTSAAWAQSSVTMYGIIDAGVRITTNSGPTAASKGDSITSVIPGGMSQSRLGFNIVEDMGGGLRGLANFEHRLASDTGAVAAADFWRQSWVGIQSADFGRITIGRQYNVLFDLLTSTFASYRYSPYAEIYKPDAAGMTLAARNDNMVKYLAEFGGLRIEAQVTAGEGAATTAGANGKGMGGIVRYANGPFAAGAGFQQVEDTAGKTVKATLIGASYSSGPIYAHAAWSQNKFETGFNATLNNTYLGAIIGAQTAATAAGGAATKRDMLMVGLNYQVTPQVNLGATYWRMNQDGVLAGANGKNDLMNFVADYAFSKRTDAYFQWDHSKLSGGLMFANTATTRDGYTVGLRHRF